MCAKCAVGPCLAGARVAIGRDECLVYQVRHRSGSKAATRACALVRRIVGIPACVDLYTKELALGIWW